MGATVWIWSMFPQCHLSNHAKGELWEIRSFQIRKCDCDFLLLLFKWLMVCQSIKPKRRKMPKPPSCSSKPDQRYQASSQWTRGRSGHFLSLRSVLHSPTSPRPLANGTDFFPQPPALWVCFSEAQRSFVVSERSWYTWGLRRGRPKTENDQTQELFFQWNFSGMNFSTLPASLSPKAAL